MLDLKILRTNIKNAAAKLKTRGYLLNITKFKTFDQLRHRLQVHTESLPATLSLPSHPW